MQNHIRKKRNCWGTFDKVGGRGGNGKLTPLKAKLSLPLLRLQESERCIGACLRSGSNVKLLLATNQALALDIGVVPRVGLPTE